jgi:ABC-type Zn uptake system ZnuABC Zn-binding protein ZnuA
VTEFLIDPLITLTEIHPVIKCIDIRVQGDVHPSGNPHYNWDPHNGKIIARNRAKGLARNFPQHAAASHEGEAHMDSIQAVIRELFAEYP